MSILKHQFDRTDCPPEVELVLCSMYTPTSSLVAPICLLIKLQNEPRILFASSENFQQKHKQQCVGPWWERSGMCVEWD